MLCSAASSSGTSLAAGALSALSAASASFRALSSTRPSPSALPPRLRGSAALEVLDDLGRSRAYLDALDQGWCPDAQAQSAAAKKRAEEAGGRAAAPSGLSAAPPVSL